MDPDLAIDGLDISALLFAAGAFRRRHAGLLAAGEPPCAPLLLLPGALGVLEAQAGALLHRALLFPRAARLEPRGGGGGGVEGFEAARIGRYKVRWLASALEEEQRGDPPSPPLEPHRPQPYEGDGEGRGRRLVVYDVVNDPGERRALGGRGAAFNVTWRELSGGLGRPWGGPQSEIEAGQGEEEEEEVRQSLTGREFGSLLRWLHALVVASVEGQARSDGAGLTRPEGAPCHRHRRGAMCATSCPCEPTPPARTAAGAAAAAPATASPAGGKAPQQLQSAATAHRAVPSPWMLGRTCSRLLSSDERGAKIAASRESDTVLENTIPIKG